MPALASATVAWTLRQTTYLVLPMRPIDKAGYLFHDDSN